MANYCSDCGAALETGTKFCAQCGTPIVDAILPPQPQAKPHPLETGQEIGTPPSLLAANTRSLISVSGSPRLVLIVIVAIAMIAIVGFFAMRRSHYGVSTRPFTELPVIVQAVIQPGDTAMQLSPGLMYLYGMSTGGARSSTPFQSGQFAQGVTASGNLAAALAYGQQNSDQYETTTYSHEICGVSVAGRWDRFDAFYGVNAELGASNATATFNVAEDSLVVFIGLGGGQNQVSLQGIPGLQVDTSNSTAGADIAMVVAHAPLRAGRYSVTEITAETRDMGADNKANLIGVFVFGSGR